MRAALGLALLGLAGCGDGSDLEPQVTAGGRDDGVGASDPGLSPNARVAMHEELRADAATPRDASDGGGTARLVLAEGETGAVRAGTRGDWRFEFVAGPLGIAPGGALLFQVGPFWGWSQPQVLRPDALGYTTVTSAADGVELLPEGLGPILRVEIAGRALREGETIELHYGAGPQGALADRFPERCSVFWFGVDGNGDGVRELLADQPCVDVLPGPPERLVAHVTSVARPGGTTRLTVAVLDATASPTAFEGTVHLRSLPDGLALPAELALGPGDAGHAALEVGTPAAGTFRVEARAELSGREVSWTSNPMWVGVALDPVWWGDLHGHSRHSDGTGEPEDYYRYARDVAGLDLAVLTDHDHFGMRFLDAHAEIWDGIRAQVRAFHEPGRFVALLGFEWTSWLHGHRHVLYFGDEGEVLSSIADEYDTPAELWAGLRGQPALTFTHHSAGNPVATNWAFAPDPVLEPLAEVASVHGSSEAADSPNRVSGAIAGNFVRDALDRGYVLGFVGSGDGHDGHPGLAHLSPAYGFLPARPTIERGERSGLGGLAAVRAPELTRTSLLAALRARRTWATSGPRILLDVRLGEHEAGSVLVPGGQRAQSTLRVSIAGTAPLERLDLVRSGAVVESVSLEDRLDVELERPTAPLAPGEYLYVRVHQRDGALAWSSPFFRE